MQHKNFLYSFHNRILRLTIPKFSSWQFYRKFKKNPLRRRLLFILVAFANIFSLNKYVTCISKYFQIVRKLWNIAHHKDFFHFMILELTFLLLLSSTHSLLLFHYILIFSFLYFATHYSFSENFCTVCSILSLLCSLQLLPTKLVALCAMIFPFCVVATSHYSCNSLTHENIDRQK